MFEMQPETHLDSHALLIPFVSVAWFLHGHEYALMHVLLTAAFEIWDVALMPCAHAIGLNKIDIDT
jgi:hypothetical protein